MLVDVTAAVFAAGLSGCSDKALPDQLRFETAHFRYYTFAPGDETYPPDLCDDLPDALERVQQDLESLLGFHGTKVDYFRFRSELEVIRSGFCNHRRGCAYNNTVLAAEDILPHEINHALTSPEGRPARMIEEGVAELFQCASLWYEPPTEAWQTIARIRSTDASDAAVYSGGFFLTKHVFRKFGAEALASFYRASSGEPSAAVLAFDYERRFGERFEDAWAEALREPGGSICACTGEELPTDGTVAKVAVGCSPSYRPFTIERDGDVTLRIDDAASIAIGRCDGTEAGAPIFVDARSGHKSVAGVRLGRGRYYAQVGGDRWPDRPGRRPLSWSMSPATAIFASDCGNSGRLSLDDDVAGFLELSALVAGEPLFGRIAASRPRTVVFHTDAARYGHVLLCNGCPRSPSECSSLPASGATFELDGETVFAFVPEAATPARLSVSLQVEP